MQLSGPDKLDLVRRLVNAHVYCRMKGLGFDLVIWNEERGGYRQALHDEIMAIIGTSADAGLLDRPGGVFVRSIEQINHEDRVLMLSIARVVLSDQAGSLLEQLNPDRTLRSDIVVPDLVATRAPEPDSRQSFPLPPRTLVNDLGGFGADGTEYIIAVDETHKTPLPWVNVIANPHFGCVVSESGSGYTWRDNAHEYRITPWSNDPVTDPCGEAFYLRDEESGAYWSPTPNPCPGHGRYVVRHGFGYSVFEHVEGGITSHLRVHVDPDAPVKFFMLRLKNDSDRPRKLSVTGYVEWVLGDLREKDRHARRHGTRRNRRADGAQRLQHRVPEPRCILRRRQRTTHPERRPHRIHRAQFVAGKAGCDVAAIVERTPRRGHGPLRRHTDSD